MNPYFMLSTEPVHYPSSQKCDISRWIFIVLLVLISDTSVPRAIVEVREWKVEFRQGYKYKVLINCDELRFYTKFIIQQNQIDFPTTDHHASKNKHNNWVDQFSFKYLLTLVCKLFLIF